MKNTSMPVEPVSNSINEDRIVHIVSAVGIGGNLLLSAFKLVAGLLGHSGAMVSDAVHSMSDVFATFVAFLGVILSKKKADEEHPYGHERIECVASLILGFILLLTGCGIGYEAIQKILAHETIAVPGRIALIAAVVSIISKEGMFQYTKHYAKVLNSDAFMADAWHHRSDAISSVGSLVGIGGAMLGFPIMDPIASVVICFCIFKVAIDIIKRALDNMVDTSCGEEYENNLKQYICEQDGVIRVDLIRTRVFGSKIYIDAEIAVEGTLPLTAAHAIATQVHDRVEKNFDHVKHIMIHVNPA